MRYTDQELEILAEKRRYFMNLARTHKIRAESLERHIVALQRQAQEENISLAECVDFARMYHYARQDCIAENATT